MFARAQRVLPGGVNSPVRAFKAVGGDPRFIARAAGSRIWDVDGREYIDYIGSWGPMILGHCHPDVVRALQEQCARGMSFGAPSELEVEIAELITNHMPAIEMVRFVNSGTEATMSAVRLARAATGRELIMKFEGCYHGHGDTFLSKAGSGAATLGVPTSPGVPRGAAACTLNARFNDLASVEALFDQHRDQIAAVIVEPVVGNMGCVPPHDGFLRGLRDCCTRHGALLILDEVMTGFRVAAGGAHARYGVHPDITTLGKIIGGGTPVGAYGGSRELMSRISPAGPVYQAGTLSGNPLAMAAGLSTLRHLFEHPEIYEQLESLGAGLESIIQAHIATTGHAACFQRVGSMATLFFARGPIASWDDAKDCDTAKFGKYFHHLLENGIHMPAAQFEAFFISAAHTRDDIQRTGALMCQALDAAMRA